MRLPAIVGLVLAGMVLGPHGTGLLATKQIALSSIGEFGLLYLMFSAGLELDLKLFLKMKKAAITFAALSFAVPFGLGVVSARWLGYAWAAAVLMGSNWGSHTLVTYPLLRKMGLSRNHAVATVVGATAVTDTSALLVLSVVSGMVKPAGVLWAQLVEIAVGLAVLTAWSLFVLPKLARWFFARVGRDHSYRFVFGIAAFLLGGVLAEVAGIDAIVGAFFAGLGLNRAVPEESPLMERLQFTGSTFFVPIFLVSVGVLLEPKVMADPKTLGIAAVFTVAVLGGKAVAAVAAGRAFRFSWAEVGVMSGLSGSQAAATLATTLVGSKLGLFDHQTINAVLVVILVSLVVTPALVSTFGKKLGGATEEASAIGKAVLVPVWGPSSKAVLSLAGELASQDGGIVLAAGFAGDAASPAELADARKLTSDAEDWLAKKGLESKTLFRVARTIPEGLLQAVVGENATLLVAEWRTPGRLEETGEAAEALARAPVPALFTHGDITDFERLVVVLPAAADRRAVSLAAQVGRLVAKQRRLTIVTPSPDGTRALLAAKHQVDWIQTPDPIGWAAGELRAADLPLFVGVDVARAAAPRLPGFESRRFLVVTTPAAGRPPERADSLVGDVAIGRSLKPRPA